MRPLLFMMVPLILTACGLPVASVALPDLTVDLPATVTLPVAVTTPVIYSTRNQLEGRGEIPDLVNAVGVQGVAQYLGAGTVQALDVYVRQSLDGCLTVSGFAFCGLAEDTQFLGKVMFVPRQGTPFSFGNATLLNAARAGQLYIGIRVTGNSLVSGDQLKLSKLFAVARL